MNILKYQHFYLVGIKGVAMTALAQCLVDAGKTVRGSDLAEDFVTQPLLSKLNIIIDEGFDYEVPPETECVVFTAAHQAQFNSQVQAAQKRKLPTLTHAEALAELFNQKRGIAVCGVGGKSTTSAMIAWILAKTNKRPSFAIGVGNIPGLDKTGQWSEEGKDFVAEADEYVIDPTAPSRGEEIVPRFHFLEPTVTVCTNLEFDHPDVYRDFAHTKEVFLTFFRQVKKGGTLVVNGNDKPLVDLAKNISKEGKISVVSFGDNTSADVVLKNFRTSPGKTQTAFLIQDQQYTLELAIPGKYNAYNALAAVAACSVANVTIAESLAALKSFHSTKRRAEFVGEKNGVRYYDDYAHHPNEVQQVIHAYREWFPNQRLVVAFQSHTFSRTKALFSEFVDAFAEVDEVAMIDIFPSAREAFDDSVSSTSLCEAITKRFPGKSAENFQTLPKLATHLSQTLKSGDICLTLGAGDIYQVHDLI